MIKIFVSVFVTFSCLVLVSAQQYFIDPTAQLIADVKLHDCTYTVALKQFHISCSITNKLKNQGDIRYGVQLIKTDKNKQEVVDFKVYDEVFSLTTQTVRKELEYTPPTYLSGEYELWVILKTSDGLPLSFNFLGKVQLEQSVTSYLEIQGDSCSLKIKESPEKNYTKEEEVKLALGETLEGSCIVTSHNTGDVTIRPSFIIYNRSFFGKKILDVKDVQSSVFLKNNESKVVSFFIPKVLTPQMYNSVLALISEENNLISNEIVFRYVLAGGGVTILNLLLDKNYYKSGETANVSILWSGSIENKNKKEKEDDVKQVITSLSFLIKDHNNQTCAEKTFPVSEDVRNRGLLTDYIIPIMKSCFNPNVVVTILDNHGTILTQKKTEFTSERNENSSLDVSGNERFKILGIVILFCIVCAGSFFLLIKNVLIKNRNNQNEII